MSFKIREVAQQILRNVEDNYDTSLIEYLLDNKPILRRVAGYRLQREEMGCTYFWTPLHVAARHGRMDMLKLFDQGGCMMETPDEKKRTPMWYAAAYAHNDTVIQLVEMGAKPKHADADGWSPLHAAARYGNTKTCQLLMEHGCSISHQDNAGFTALHKAIWGDHEDTVSTLLASLSPSDNSIKTRSRVGEPLVEMASLEGGITPLHLAVEGNNIQIVQMLLEQLLSSSDNGRGGASVDQANKEGLTPLMITCRSKQVDITSLLLANGANVQLTTVNGWSPIHMAVESGNVAVILALLERGAHVDARNKAHWTPFLLAAKLGQMDVMRTLKEHQADCRATTGGKGYTAVHLAAEQGNAYALRYLLSEVGLPADQISLQGGHTPLHLAATRGHVQCCTVLLEAGCPINKPDTAGHSALHLASANRHLGLLKLLLTNGASILHTGPAFRAQSSSASVSSASSNGSECATYKRTH